MTAYELLEQVNERMFRPTDWEAHYRAACLAVPPDLDCPIHSPYREMIVKDVVSRLTTPLQESK